MRSRAVLGALAAGVLLVTGMLLAAGAAGGPRHLAIDGRGTPLLRPRHVFFGAHGIVDHITWGDWHGRRAHGHGSIPYNDCVPNCAEGTITRYPVKTVYSRLRRCRGRRLYVRFTYIYRDQMPAGVPRRTPIGFGYLCRSG